MHYQSGKYSFVHFKDLVVSGCLLVLLALPCAAFQQSKTDSLRALVQESEGKEKAYFLTELAQHFWYSDPQESIKYGIQAVKAAKEANVPKRIAFANNALGFAHNLAGDYASAVGYLLEALETFEAMDSTQLASRVYNNLGIVYLNQGNYPKAEEYFGYYSAEVEKAGLKQELANACANLGVVYYRKEEYDKAIVFHKKYLALSKELEDELGIAIAKSNLADVYKAQKEYERALTAYRESLEISEKLNDTEGIIISKAGIGSVLGFMGNPQKGQPLLQEALELSVKYKFRSYQQDNYRMLAVLHRQMGDYSVAYDFQEKFVVLKDSIFSKRNADQINSLQKSYEVAKKQTEIDLQETQINLLNKEKALQNTITLSIVIGLLLVTGVAALQYRNIRLKQKAYALLKKQKEEISFQKEEIEQQKEEILTQNEELQQQQEEIMAQRDAIEAQKKKLEEAYSEIDSFNRDIRDSINYAQRIQQAILPFESRVKELLPGFFAIYRPRDVVSGDFYWVQEVQKRIVIASVDCTGHGVPGAFMSMIGNELLNEIVMVRKIIEPEQILKEMNERIGFTLSQETSKNSDGMDMAVCTINPLRKKVYYAGAKTPIMYVKDWQVHVIKGGRDSIGGFDSRKKDEVLPERHVIDVDEPTWFYLTSDGFPDQFGGSLGKKYGWKRFREDLLQIHSLPALEQKKKLEEAFDHWKKSEAQIDDVMVLGFHVS